MESVLSHAPGTRLEGGGGGIPSGGLAVTWTVPVWASGSGPSVGSSWVTVEDIISAVRIPERRLEYTVRPGQFPRLRTAGSGDRGVGGFPC